MKKTVIVCDRCGTEITDRRGLHTVVIGVTNGGKPEPKDLCTPCVGELRVWLGARPDPG